MKIVVKENSEERLDKYLAVATGYSRSLITKMIENGFITINDETKKLNYKVRANDEIEIDESYTEKTDIKPKKMKLDIVYEDKDLMIINKPSGLVVHPGNGNYDNTLVNGLMAYTSDLSNLGGTARVGIVHRIDKDTSGLMVVAKTNKCHELLSEMFQKHDVKRTYYALVCGVVPYNKAIIDAPIRRDSAVFNKMTVAEDGKKAITHLEVLKRYKKYTLLKLNLETGRTHQIRVHLNYIGYPIYNDPVYNKGEATEFGQFLHSKEIDFIHPINKKKIHYEVALPKEFQEFIDNLD